MAYVVTKGRTVAKIVVGPTVINDYILTVEKKNEAEYTLKIRRGGEEQTVNMASPYVETEETEDGVRVTVTDANGPKTFEVHNGRDGQDGKDGGIRTVNGVSPDENGNVEVTGGRETVVLQIAFGDEQNADHGVTGTAPTGATWTLTHNWEQIMTLLVGDKPFDVIVKQLVRNNSGGYEYMSCAPAWVRWILGSPKIEFGSTAGFLAFTGNDDAKEGLYLTPENKLVYGHTVYFYSHDGATLLDTQTAAPGGSVTYGGSAPTRSSTEKYDYTFAGWSRNMNDVADSNALTNVTADRSVYAAYTSAVREYTVYFYNGGTLLQTVDNVPYGGSATYTGDTPVSEDGTADDGYEFTGFVPTGSNITGTTSCYAQYTVPVKVAEITDDWDTIRRNVAAGIHQKTYSVGNYKSLDLGDEGTVTMQIVAFAADETEDGDKAPITWVARELLKTNHRMNPSNSNNTEGTGSIGGWEKSEMRTYLNDTIKPLIPEETRKQIKPVKKVSNAYDTSESAFQNNTVDEIWIPSYREIFKGSDLETTGPMYSAVYSDNASRVKMKADATSAASWWLRSAGGTGYFRYVASNGDWYNSRANNSYGVALGFSTGSDTIKDSWEEILAALDDGSYKTKYAVGDTKLLDLGSEGVVCATLVGIDTDDLADGSGKAKMTWLTEELLTTSRRMNASISGNSTDGYVEGTGAIGGWEKSEMRSYMKETLKPLIPEAVRNRIATVTKTQPACDTTGASVTQTTQDDVWVPGYDELYSSSGLYRSVFPNNASRIKRKSGSTSAALWWSRSAGSTNDFRCVYSNGDWAAYTADSSFDVALGFCLN